MKLTLLDLVQEILSSLDSDEVNSISDTTESNQVAHIVRTAYYNILTRADLPEHRKTFRLEGLGDEDTPTLMQRPSNVDTIEWIKYDANLEAGIPDEPEYKYVSIVPLDCFLEYVHGYNADDATVGSFVHEDTLFYYRNDRAPTLCASLRDAYVVFDAYDSDVDDTLQASKTVCYGHVLPVFSMVDDFYPDLDARQYPLLLNEAKSIAFQELKQLPNESSMREARRQWNALSRNKYLTGPNPLDRLPDYGRR